MYAGRASELGGEGRALRPSAAPVHVGPARVDPEVDPEGLAAPRDRGLAALADQPAARLPVPSALPVPLRAVRQRRARVQRPGRRAQEACHLSVEDKRSIWVGARGAERDQGRRVSVAEARIPSVPDAPRARRALVERREPDEVLPDHARDPLPARDRARCTRSRTSRFDVHPGETLGLVGESGCGKSTTARLIMRLLEPTAGKICFDGRTSRSSAARPDAPAAARDADHLPGPVLVAEPAADGRPDHRRARSRSTRRRRTSRRRVRELMDRVGLNPEHYNRYPHEFSGGQRQRIGVARALALCGRS